MIRLELGAGCRLSRRSSGIGPVFSRSSAVEAATVMVA